MKPLVLVLTVVLFATLLNLVSAATKPGSKVVVSAATKPGSKVVQSYKGYDKRQFPKKTTIACVRARGWNNMDKAEKLLQSMAGGNNDQKKTVALGKGGIMIKKKWSKAILYCKIVPGAYAGPTRIGKNKKKLMKVFKAPRYAFYARKAADKSPKTIQATAAKVAALVKAEKGPKKRIFRGSIIVEITAANEIYVGRIARRFIFKRNKVWRHG